MRRSLLLAIAACLLQYTLALPLAGADEVTISAVGDIMLSGSARPVLEQHGYAHAFAATRTLLAGSDIVVGNLEAPITNAGNEFTGKRFRFRAPLAVAPALRQAGFSVLTLANNHILDFGAAGLADTLGSLKGSSIRFCGAGSSLEQARAPAIIETQGKRIAFLAYSLTYPAEFFAGPKRAGTAPGYTPLVTADVRAARKIADYVVVSFHWGRELAGRPQPYQTRIAHQAIDAGADLILGHHPHVLQGIERYRDGVIFYSLGNFAFGSGSRASDRSIVARITLDGGIRQVEVFPLNVLNRQVRFQPRVLVGERGEQVIRKLNRLSAGMGTHLVKSGQRYLVTEFGSGQHLARK